jgi:hypothetical protein
VLRSLRLLDLKTNNLMTLATSTSTIAASKATNMGELANNLELAALRYRLPGGPLGRSSRLYVEPCARATGRRTFLTVLGADFRITVAARLSLAPAVATFCSIHPTRLIGAWQVVVAKFGGIFFMFVAVFDWFGVWAGWVSSGSVRRDEKRLFLRPDAHVCMWMLVAWLCVPECRW